MERLIQPIGDWFLPKQEHLCVFSECDIRVEGWFKGEFAVLLSQLQRQGVISGFEREAKIPYAGGRYQVDFRLALDGQEHICELKACCISRAAGTPRNLAFYFRDDHVGLFKDFRKLDAIPAEPKWVLGFVYPRPGAPAWAAALQSLPNDLRHWECVTDPQDYPQHLFVSLWRP